MKKILFALFFFTFGLLFSLLIFRFALTDKSQRQKEFNDRYAVFAFDLPDTISFSGDKIPLNEMDVRERLEKEMLVNVYWQSQTLLNIKKASRWFPIIEPILKKNGIPDDFKYLAVAESGLSNVVSPSGASGYWQFLEATGKKYNLEINSDVDERYDLEKSTQAACDYFKEAFAMFNNWSLVAASYNMGIDGVKKSLEKQQEKNYFSLLLNEETARYLFRIVALKEIISHPLQYGFHFRKRDLYTPFPYTTVHVDSSISDLVAFSKLNGISYKELKLLNPWLRQSSFSNKSAKNYTIKIIDKASIRSNYWGKDSL